MEAYLLLTLSFLTVVIVYLLPLILSLIASPYAIKHIFYEYEGDKWLVTLGDLIVIIVAFLLAFTPILNWWIFIQLEEAGYLDTIKNKVTKRIVSILNFKVIGSD
jgi:glucose-6-phosphate dehydrogenase assembly protein OpcA